MPNAKEDEGGDDVRSRYEAEQSLNRSQGALGLLASCTAEMITLTTGDVHAYPDSHARDEGDIEFGLVSGAGEIPTPEFGLGATKHPSPATSPAPPLSRESSDAYSPIHGLRLDVVEDECTEGESMDAAMFVTEQNDAVMLFKEPAGEGRGTLADVTNQVEKRMSVGDNFESKLLHQLQVLDLQTKGNASSVEPTPSPPDGGARDGGAAGKKSTRHKRRTDALSRLRREVESHQVAFEEAEHIAKNAEHVASTVVGHANVQLALMQEALDEAINAEEMALEAWQISDNTVTELLEVVRSKEAQWAVAMWKYAAKAVLLEKQRKGRVEDAAEGEGAGEARGREGARPKRRAKKIKTKLMRLQGDLDAMIARLSTQAATWEARHEAARGEPKPAAHTCVRAWHSAV